MAKYSAVNGVYRKVSKKYDPVDGVYRNVTKAYEPVDGVYRQYFSGSKPIPASELAVGDSVWLNVEGVQTEFLVVHQGNPDSAKYDASCDGTWLLMNNLCTYLKSHASYVYSMSSIHTYLRDTFFPLFDTDVQSIIKQVKIPYNKVTGANGLSTKLFLLSAHEVGSITSSDYRDGAILDYFSNCIYPNVAYAERIAYRNGTAYEWWLRTPKDTSTMYFITADGECGSVGTGHVSNLKGVRPALILDSNTPIDPSTHTIAT